MRCVHSDTASHVSCYPLRSSLVAVFWSPVFDLLKAFFAHADAALVLNEVGPICQQGQGETKKDMMDRGVQQLVKRLVLQRQEQDEDSDFSD